MLLCVLFLAPLVYWFIFMHLLTTPRTCKYRSTPGGVRIFIS